MLQGGGYAVRTNSGQSRRDRLRENRKAGNLPFSPIYAGLPPEARCRRDPRGSPTTYVENILVSLSKRAVVKIEAFGYAWQPISE